MIVLGKHQVQRQNQSDVTAKCHLLSTLVNSHQLFIYSHKLPSTLINSYQFSSIHINSHQLPSTLINTHQLSTVVESHQLFNFQQLSIALINSHPGLTRIYFCLR